MQLNTSSADLHSFLEHNSKLNTLSVGSQEWWDELENIGTPLLLPTDSGYADACFIWRNTASYPVAAVYLDIHGITDHHSFTPDKFTQYQDSDLYYFCCRLPNAWRGAYAFVPVPEDGLQPHYHGTMQEQKQQHRQWLMSTMANYATVDPLQKRNLPNCLWGKEYSQYAMQEAPYQPGWERFDQTGGEAFAQAEVIEFTWQSELMNKSRQVWCYSTSSSQATDLPIIIMQDGDFWAKQMPVFSALDDNTQSGYLPEAVYVMIDAINRRHRGEDLTCNPIYWQAIQQELLPQIEALYQVSRNPLKTVVAGQSYGGLTSMYAALHWPERFGCVVSSSGSFWWPHREQIRQQSKDEVLPTLDAKFVDFIQNELPKEVTIKSYLDVGLREKRMVELNQQVADALLAHGQVKTLFSTYDGGHERLCWRGGLMQGLHYVLSE